MTICWYALCTRDRLVNPKVMVALVLFMMISIVVSLMVKAAINIFFFRGSSCSGPDGGVGGWRRWPSTSPQCTTAQPTRPTTGTTCQPPTNSQPALDS